MREGIKELIVLSFRVWTNNLKIAVPVALSPLTVALWSGAVIAAALAINPPPGTLVSAAVAGDPAALAVGLRHYVSSSLPFFVAAVVVWGMGSATIQAFFDSGSIGMSIEANELYRCSVGDMLRYGKENALNMLLADLLMFLAMAAAGGAVAFPMLSSGAITPLAAEPGPAILIPLVPVFALVYLFLPVRYALVSEGLGPLSAVAKGVRFTLRNPLSVLAVLAAAGLVSAVANLPADLVGTEAQAAAQLYSLSVGVFFVGPYTRVLWTRLYLNRTGRQLVENRNYG